MIERSDKPLRGARWAAPEIVALLILIVVYASVAVWSLPDRSSDGTPPTSGASQTALPSSTTAADVHPRRGDVLAVIEIDTRLANEREALQGLLDGATLRGSEVATVLRRISGRVVLGIERASRLSLDPTFQVPGAQLEILYADAAASVDEALDAAIANDAPYREAAERLVDLFVDLPEIDAELLAILERAESTPSTTDAPSASPTTTLPSAPVPSPTSYPQPSADAAERLIDPGFERGGTAWVLTERPPGASTIAEDGPLAGIGSRSLRIDAGTSVDSASVVTLGQPGIRLAAGARYVGQVVVRASQQQSLRLRVVGPHQEAHGLSIVEVGPEPVIATIEFTALVDDDAASFLIELPGPWSGSVWLDDVSLLQRPD